MNTEVKHGSDEFLSKETPKKIDSLGSLFVFETEKTRKLIVAKASMYREKITVDTLRPLPVFLGITGPAFCLAPDAFTPPSTHLDKDTVEKLKQRLEINWKIFITNYALIATGIYIIVILLHPRMIISCSILYFLWKIHNVMVKESIPLTVMGTDIGSFLTVEKRTKVLYILTMLVVYKTCLRPLLVASSLTGLIVITHAIMRDPKQVDLSDVGRATRFSKDGYDSDDENDSSSGSEVMV